ncbi:MAG: ABC transporter ATP-binding protein [Lachnospiraceae bacterium]
MRAGNAIEVNDVTKRFKVFFDKGNSLKEKMLFWSRNRYEEHWVLKGISFEIKKGETVGLIGKNGCGKSTTLKMLTRIMFPTKGTIEMDGRVSSLLELGAGFHPDMSGRENIFTNASIFGLHRTEIESRLDDIIKFSELEEYIDNPVRTYSSGMYMRLAFAVAINVDADILLIDEILAVGDVNFQTKCFEKLNELKRQGKTIVIVTHVMSQIEKICNRAIWIEDGLIKEDGIPKNISEHYLAMMEEKRVQKIEQDFEKQLSDDKLKSDKEADEVEEEKNVKQPETVVEEKKLPSFCDVNATRIGNREIEIIDFTILNGENRNQIVFKTGDTIKFHIEYKCNQENEVDFRLGISRSDGIHCYGNTTFGELGTGIRVDKDGYFELEIRNLNLWTGRYWIDIGIKTKDQINLDVIHGVHSFEIAKTNSYETGITRLEHSWKF